MPDYAEASVLYDEDIERVARKRGCQTEVKDGVLYISAFGKSAHGSAPDKGVNALVILCEALGAANADFNAIFRGLFGS